MGVGRMGKLIRSQGDGGQRGTRVWGCRYGGTNFGVWRLEWGFMLGGLLGFVLTWEGFHEQL